MTPPSANPTLAASRAALDGPLCFQPYLRPMVWGGRRLGAVLGRPLPDEQPYGESWEVSDHAGHASVVAGGRWAGRTLRELTQHHRAELLGAAARLHERFPWLVKFLDCHDWLSVQVHPDDEQARLLWPGEIGKTEVWFILDVLPGGRVYAGLRPGVDEAALRAALAAGRAAECLHSFTPRPGDSVFLPAGTVHAVGGGVLMAEVQQTSDATFRLYDWDRRDAQGRSRALHVEESIRCIDWSKGPVAPVRAESWAALTGDATPAVWPRERRVLARCSYFELDYVSDTGAEEFGEAGCLQMLIVLAGRGRLESADGAAALERGQVWVLPADMGRATLRPDGGICYLRCRLPQ
jgi:mannose-6-phosphate isomerase